MITSVFSVKLCKKGDNKNVCICCCIWFNSCCWTHSVNWELVRMMFIWPWFLVLVLLSKSNFCQSELWQLKQKGSLLVYLKFLPQKFPIACFYRTFSRPWCLLKKVFQWISKIIELTTWVWSFFIQAHFASARQYL